MARCMSSTDRGTPCQMNARTGSAHCIAHDPEYHDQHVANAAEGGIASGEARRIPSMPLNVPGFSLGDRRHIQLILDAVLRMDLAGRIEPARARRVLKGLSLAIRNFDRPGRERELDAMHYEHDFSDMAEEFAAFEAAFPAWAIDAIQSDQLRLDLQVAHASNARKHQAADLALYPNLHPSSRRAQPVADPQRATVDSLLQSFGRNPAAPAATPPGAALSPMSSPQPGADDPIALRVLDLFFNDEDGRGQAAG